LRRRSGELSVVPCGGVTMQITLGSKLAYAIGDKSARPLDKAFGMTTVEDLLRHYPRRYLEIGALTPLRNLIEGQHVTVMARVSSAKNYPMHSGRGRKRSRTEVIVTDDTGELTLTFFNQPWRASMERGEVGLFAGVVGS